MIRIALAIASLTATPCIARDLIYTPVNPVFGGSPLNAGTMSNLATSNNRFRTSPESREQQRATSTSNAQQFERQITASLLSQIATTVGQQILGENARDSGTFNVGGTVVQFNRVGGQINIDITEAASGGRTNIQIPAPQF
jgi:curli production assembly/transport component CsgF